MNLITNVRLLVIEISVLNVSKHGKSLIVGGPLPEITNIFSICKTSLKRVYYMLTKPKKLICNSIIP